MESATKAATQRPQTEREMVSAFIGLYPEEDVLVRDTERVQLGWARGVGWAGDRKIRPNGPD
jgi:hypothetical protein